MAADNRTIVKQLEDSFSTIGQSIHSLKECSNTDFTTLAHSFEVSVKSVSQLLTISKTIFSTVDAPSTESVINEIKDIFYKNEAVLCQIRASQLKLAEHKTSTDFLQHLFLVYLENCSQDLKTFSTLGKSMFMSDRSAENKNLIAILEQMAPIANQTSFLIRRLYALQQKIRVEYDTALDFFTDESFQTLGFIDEPFVEAEREYIKKQKLVTDSYSVFAQREKSHSSCLSDIVTNLQYNDIITQKIEHVSEIISDVSLRLKHVGYSNEDCQFGLPNVHKAVELQSAQLVQINIDYQEAVKTIFRRLSELSENASDIALITHVFYSKHGRENSFFSDLSQHLKLPANYFSIVSSAYKVLETFVQETSPMVQELKALSQEIDMQRQMFAQMHEVIHHSSIDREASLRLLLSKVSENINYIADTVLVFGGIAEKTIERANAESYSLDRIEKSYNQLMQNLQKQEEITLSNICKTTEIANAVQTDLDGLLKGVSYYSVFETEIEHISTELNTIISLLEQSVGEDFMVDESFFESLKQYYTMKSEHDVHDTVLLLTPSGDNNFDDIEFF
jgi:RNAse (barnase) inhibitor barstar